MLRVVDVGERSSRQKPRPGVDGDAAEERAAEHGAVRSRARLEHRRDAAAMAAAPLLGHARLQHGAQQLDRAREIQLGLTQARRPGAPDESEEKTTRQSESRN